MSKFDRFELDMVQDAAGEAYKKLKQFGVPSSTQLIRNGNQIIRVRVSLVKADEVLPPAITKSPRICKFCGRDISEKVSLQSYESNPFCNECYDQRVKKAQEETEKERGKFIGWKQDGHYIAPVFEKDGIEPDIPKEK